MTMTRLYIVNVEAAIFRAGRYLIIQRSAAEEHAAGLLSLPGGKVEDAGFADDILEHTLRREIEEEVGLNLTEPLHYIESKAFVADDGEPVIDLVFWVEMKTGEPIARDPAEVAAIHWMTAEAILQHEQAPAWLKRSIEFAEAHRYTLSPSNFAQSGYIG